MCDFILTFLGTFPHTLEDTVLFVRSDYRPKGMAWKGITLHIHNIGQSLAGLQLQKHVNIFYENARKNTL